MTYNEFIKEMEQRVQTKLGNKYSVKLVEKQKNNNSIWHGLLIKKNEDDIAPIIYLKDFFESVSIPDAADEIVKYFYSLDKPKNLSGCLDLNDFATVKNKIFCKVINYEKNREMLKNVPFTKFKDLAIVCYISVESNSWRQLSIQIKNGYLKEWNITKQELEKIARENTKKMYPMVFMGISEVILSLKGRPAEVETLEEDIPMFVFSNNENINGAINIIYNDWLENIAKKLEDNYYILPSSVHELIIMPEGAGCPKDFLETMVADINATEVKDEDVLSNTVYFYDRIEKKLL